MGVRRCLLVLAGLVLAAGVFAVAEADRASEPIPGWIEKSDNCLSTIPPSSCLSSDGIRTRLDNTAINTFMPSLRGSFTFPAPYNTTGIRITDSSDCPSAEAEKDCVGHVGPSGWRNSNNHAND